MARTRAGAPEIVMRRSIWLAPTLLVALCVPGWWLIERHRSAEKSLGAIEGPPPDDEARSGDPSLLLAGGRATKIMPAAGRNAPSPYEIHVLVVDEADRPMPDVSVSARSTDQGRDPEDAAAWGDPTADDRMRAAIAAIDDPRVGDASSESDAKTDASGQVGLFVPRPGNYEISALPAAGLVSSRESVNPTHDKPSVSSVIRMSPGSALAGRVVDEADRGVVAIVTGQWAKDDFDGWNYLAIAGVATDVDGAFTFPAVPDGRGRLLVRIAGRGSFSGYVATTPTKDRLVLRIPAGGAVRGRITDTTGQPVQGADVTVTTAAVKPTPPFTARGGVARGKAGLDGTYRIEGVVAGRVASVSVVATGFVSLTQAAGCAPWTGAVLKEGDELPLDLTLFRGGSVKGRILERASKDLEVPVVDAEVFLLGPTGTDSGTPIPRVANVDASGEFSFPDVPLGKYVLYARSPSHYLPNDPNGVPIGLEGPSKLPGGAGTQSTLLVLSKEGEALEKTLWMTKGISVTGVVKGPDGAPVAGASIRAQQNSFFDNAWQYGIQAQTPQTLATSGPDGRFTIPGLQPIDECTLCAHKSPFASKWCAAFPVTTGERPPDVVLELERGGSISGRAVDAEGKGAVGINVSASSQEGGASDSVTSGSDGVFRLSGLLPGAQQLGAWSAASGGVNQMLDPPLKAGEDRVGLELRLVPQVKSTSKFSGVLVDEEGAPVGERYLSAQVVNGSSAWAQTDGDGAFTFRGLGTGKATLTLQTLSGNGNWASQAIPGATFDVPSSGARVVMPKPMATTVVVGRVLSPEGTPVPLCQVTASVAETKATAASPSVAAFSVGGEVIGGEFRHEVPAGRAFELTVVGARDAEGKPLNYRESKTPVLQVTGPLVVRLEAGKLVRGRVLSSEGKGIADATVNSPAGSVTSDEDGAFEILGLEGDEVSLTVDAVGSYMAPSKPTLAKAGAIDVEIRLEAGISISGRVVDAGGQPVDNGSVQAVSTSGERRTWHAQVDGNGAFRIDNVPREGVYDLAIQFWGSDGRLANYKPWTKSGVKAGTDDLVARVEGGEVIEGVVVDSDGAPVPSAWVNATSASGGRSSQGAQTGETGHFAVGGLDPGTYILRASVWNGQQRSSLPARAETGARDVRIVMPNSVKLAGRLLSDGDKSGFSIVVRLAGPIARDSWPQIAQCQSDAEGAFSLDIPIDTFVDVQVSKGSDDRFGYLANVRGGNGDVSIGLVEGRSIEGSVEDASGNPIVGNTWVTAFGATWFAWGSVDGAGKFHIRGLPAGAYHLNASSSTRPSGRPASHDAEAGATGVRLRFPD